MPSTCSVQRSTRWWCFSTFQRLQTVPYFEGNERVCLARQSVTHLLLNPVVEAAGLMRYLASRGLRAVGGN